MKNSGVATAALAAIADSVRARGSLTLGDVVTTMGPAGIAFTILILALPALTPVPGPIGLVFGSALAFVAIQIAIGRKTIWLPDFLGNRRLSAKILELVVSKTTPLVARVERFVHAGRLQCLTGRFAQTLIGLPVLIMAIAIALPIPLGNFLPVVALVVLAVGLMENDGLITLFGLALTLVAAGVTAILLYSAASFFGNVAA